jgi:hypothetical protein
MSITSSCTCNNCGQTISPFNQSCSCGHSRDVIISEQKQIEQQINKLRERQVSLGKQQTNNVRSTAVFQNELNKLKEQREALQKAVLETTEALLEHDALISKFVKGREDELQTMFHYGESVITDTEIRGYTFKGVTTINGYIIPSDKKCIGLFFHWIEDRRGEWMRGRKVWSITSLREAIDRVEQEYEYDRSGR